VGSPVLIDTHRPGAFRMAAHPAATQTSGRRNGATLARDASGKGGARADGFRTAGACAGRWVRGHVVSCAGRGARRGVVDGGPLGSR